MNDLRRDAVSKEWVIVATNRGKLPRTLVRPMRTERRPSPKSTCPFEHLETSTGWWPPILSYPNDTHWETVIVPNQFPAVTHHQACVRIEHEGPYSHAAAIGHHDLLITRDHNKSFMDLSSARAARVLLMLQERFRTLSRDRCLMYTSAFMNWGALAGASQWHPHYQIITLPIIPPHVATSLAGSRVYYRAHRRCVHCDMLRYELKDGSRIVVRSRGAVAFVPFASSEPFEARVFPVTHRSFFDETPARDIRSVAACLQKVLRMMRRALRDPDLNFYIHSAPLKERSRHRHYHWHIEVVPRVSTLGGLELSTSVKVNGVDPAEGARILRTAR